MTTRWTRTDGRRPRTFTRADITSTSRMTGASVLLFETEELASALEDG
jgi:hypothetical protein